MSTRRTLLLDGAIGTELQRRDAEIDAAIWTAAASLDQQELLRALHQDYVEAGADVLTTNTFFCSKQNLVHAGRAADFVALNRTAASVARRVADEADRNILVAGSLSTMPPLDRAQYLDVGPLTTGYFKEQIQILRDAGVDFLLLEMIIETETARTLLDACAAFDLPVWVGLSASISESSGELIGFRRPGSYRKMSEEPLETLVGTVMDFQPAAVGVMHTRIELLDDALALVCAHSPPRVFAYPNVGHFAKPRWVFPDDAERQHICAGLNGLVDRHSLTMVGGCCGTTPSFIAELAAFLRTDKSN